VQATSGNEIDCAAVHDMAHDYVLAESSEARLQIELHCSRCARCQALVDDLLNTAALVALGSPLAAPPASAKNALFARIAQSSRDLPAVEPIYQGSLAALTTPTIPSSSGMFAPAAPAARDVETAPRRSWWSIYAAPLATLPLLFALGFVGYWGITTRMELNDQTNTVDDLNARVQLLNSKVDALSAGFTGFDEFLNNGAVKEYAMLDPAPGADETQASGLLIANPQGDNAVLLAWELDPSIDSYKVTVQLPSGETVPISDLYTDNEGDAIQMLDLGMPISQVASIHVKPNVSGLSNDSQVGSVTPDALYATIWPGLGREQDTRSNQQP
jgi:hypothetical protein